jgi:hypothetical protein
MAFQFSPHSRGGRGGGGAGGWNISFMIAHHSIMIYIFSSIRGGRGGGAGGGAGGEGVDG